MATSSNATQITPPRVPIIDQRTGAVSREWYRWFYSLYNIVGGGLGVIPVNSGGTGLSTIPTNGQLLIGNGAGYSLNTLAVGAGISVVNGVGTITLANTGVLSNIAGSGISVSNATGDVTITNAGVLSFAGGTTGLTPAAATTGNITLAGTLGITNGGTNGSATPTAYGVAYGTGTAYAFTAAGTAKQVLIANTSAAPTWATLTSGASILYGDASGGFSNVTIGSGISFAGGTLSATGSGGTVTSVTGTSPISSSGGTTPAISLDSAYGDTLNPYGTKTANYVLAGPTTGAAAVPTFRALVATDVPGSALTRTNDTNVTLTLGGSPTTALLNAASLTLGWTGTLGTTRGGTGLGSFTANGIVYASSTSALATGSALTFDGTNFVTTGSATATGFIPSGSSVPTNGLYLPAANTVGISTNSTVRMRIDSTGNVGINTAPATARILSVGGNMTGATGAYGVLVSPTIQPDVTVNALVTASQAATAANGGTPYTVAALACFNAAQGTFNADSTVTNQYGFAATASLTGATNNYGFYSNIATAANRYNFYANGTAPNRFSGDVQIFGAGGLGYTTGSGGTTTQGTSRTTGVTLSKTNGAITMFTAAGSMVAATFTVTNTLVAATDTIILNQKSGTNLYVFLVTAVAAGSFNITFYTTGGVASDAPVINFSVIKAVAA